MVDVVRLRVRIAHHIHEVREGEDNIVQGECLAGEIFLVQREAEALVEAVAADAGEVVAVFTEERGDEFLGVLRGRHVAIAQTLVDFHERFFNRLGAVALDGILDPLLEDGGLGEEVFELFVGLGTKDAQEGDRRELALAVDTHREHTVRFTFEFDPHAARREQLRAVHFLTLLFLDAEEHAVGACELRHDDALHAVDHESAVRGHHREVGQEDLLFLLFAIGLVGEADDRAHRSLQGQFLIFGVGFVALCLADGQRNELQVKFLAGVVFDWGEFFKSFFQAGLKEGLEGTGLVGDQVRHGDARRTKTLEKLLLAHNDVQLFVNSAPFTKLNTQKCGIQRYPSLFHYFIG